MLYRALRPISRSMTVIAFGKADLQGKQALEPPGDGLRMMAFSGGTEKTITCAYLPRGKKTNVTQITRYLKKSY